MEKKEKKFVNTKKLILIIIITTIFLVSTTYLALYFYDSYKNKKLYDDLEVDIATEEISKVNNGFKEKVKELQQENSDTKGWIRINDTNINYPLLQTTDNDYYVTHNYKKEKSKYGSVFLNCYSNLKDIYSNVIIYGHDMKDNQMFGDILKYNDKEYYKSHPNIEIITEEGTTEYQIVYVFKSRIFNKDETDVFRYYHYYNLNDKNKYNEYLENCKKIQLYDTEVTAEYGEQLITLITCEYSQDNGRMVVVAKKISSEN